MVFNQLTLVFNYTKHRDIRQEKIGKYYYFAVLLLVRFYLLT